MEKLFSKAYLMSDPKINPIFFFISTCPKPYVCHEYFFRAKHKYEHIFYFNTYFLTNKVYRRENHLKDNYSPFRRRFIFELIRDQFYCTSIY